MLSTRVHYFIRYTLHVLREFEQHFNVYFLSNDRIGKVKAKTQLQINPHNRFTKFVNIGLVFLYFVGDLNGN